MSVLLSSDRRHAAPVACFWAPNFSNYKLQGLTQRAYAHWERNPVALRPDQLLNLAQTLNVSVDDLVGTNGTKKRGSGPTGKMRQLFEAASRLPRSQQQKIAAIIEPFIAHHAGR